jgi:leader peptidase (prepilin peptidase)/N-methyltransferase
MRNVEPILFAVVLGLVAGSFLNVVIARLPEGRSIVFPASHCPRCGHRLRAWENIPVLSWIVLRGRCHSCHAEISSRYPMVELATAALFVLAVARWGMGLQAVEACAAAALLVATLYIDVDHLLVLDSVLFPAALAAVACGLGLGTLRQSLEGGLVGVGIFGLLYAVTRGAGLGFGDVKLAGVLGLFLGPGAAVAAFVVAFLVGAACAVPVLVARRRGGKDVLPLGPFLVVAATVMLYAPALVWTPYALYQVFLYRHLGGS